MTLSNNKSYAAQCLADGTFTTLEEAVRFIAADGYPPYTEAEIKDSLQAIYLFLSGWDIGHFIGGTEWASFRGRKPTYCDYIYNHKLGGFALDIQDMYPGKQVQFFWCRWDRLEVIYHPVFDGFVDDLRSKLNIAGLIGAPLWRKDGPMWHLVVDPYDASYSGTVQAAWRRKVAKTLRDKVFGQTLKIRKSY